MSIELSIYKLVLFGVILPIFGFVAPIFLAHQAVVDLYRLVRRLGALQGWDLPQVEQVNFEGRAFLVAGTAVTLTALVAFAIRFTRSMIRHRAARALPDAPGERRFRQIPERLLSDVEAKVTPLWRNIGQGPSPAVVCFASTGSAACVTVVDGRQAIALSSGLIDELLKGNERLAQVILLHEMAHLVGGDVTSFRRLAAFVEAYRWIFVILLLASGVTFAISAPAEYFNLAGIDQRSPSLPAYLTRAARDLMFTYISMILVLRYVALIVMLTELRADLRAAITLGSFSAFASTVRAASGFRPSGSLHFVQTLVGTKVAHLTAGERLDLLERPSRLFTPKYRYFAASIALCFVLIVNGSLAFSGFDWVLQAGVIAAVAALNAITIAMLLANDFTGMKRIAALRMLGMATMVVAANLAFLLLPSEVMGTTDTLVVAITDPNFSYLASDIIREWYSASVQPVADPLLDGRAASWVVAVLATLWCSTRVQSSQSRGKIAAVAGIAAACLTMLAAAASPFATYLLLPRQLYDARNPLRQLALTIGPPMPIVAAGLTGLVLLAIERISRRRREGKTPARGTAAIPLRYEERPQNELDSYPERR